MDKNILTLVLIPLQSLISCFQLVPIILLVLWKWSFADYDLFNNVRLSDWVNQSPIYDESSGISTTFHCPLMLLSSLDYVIGIHSTIGSKLNEIVFVDLDKKKTTSFYNSGRKTKSKRFGRTIGNTDGDGMDKPICQLEVLVYS
ncbi:hypothetical protein ACTA71_012172 [Dictyostelium dimigraforme]